ncbi:MAG TPA: NUDIX domain-containing protein [Gaiellaceae bacterium]|jgi:dATP pyrophosphohydrolase
MRSGSEVAIFVARRGRSEILIVHRSPEDGGYWHTIAGGVDPGEEVRDAAVRELREETGLEVGVLQPADTATEVWYPLSDEAPERRDLYEPGLERVHVDCFLVDAPDDWEPELNQEHDEYRWCATAVAPSAFFWPDTADALRRLLVSTP